MADQLLDAAALESALEQHIRVPASVGKRFLADQLMAEVYGSQGSINATTITALRGISTGKASAGKYHRLIFNIFNDVFDSSLSEGKVEEKEAGGRKFIDIVYRNSASEGFFYDLRNTESVDARYVVIECKNYGGDISNPEVDQLRGRLNRDVGNFGIIVCRKLDDRTKLIARLADAKRDDKHIMVLLDSDVENLIQYRLRDEDEAIDELLHIRWRELVFN